MNHGSVERIEKAIDGINPEEKLIVLEYLAKSIRTGKAKAPSKYSFSDLAGRLTWSGDAVEEQRKLRKEW